MHSATLRAGLAESLWHLGRFAEAETLLTAAWTRVEEAGDTAHAFTVAAQLVEFYDAWDRVEPGCGHDRSADAWRQRRAPSDANGPEAARAASGP